MAGPVKSFRCQNVVVAIFKNDGNMHTVKVSTAYRKTGDSKWQYSDSLGAKDALVGAHLLKKAADWIMENDTGRTSYQAEHKPTESAAKTAGDRSSKQSPSVDEHADMCSEDGDIVPF